MNDKNENIVHEHEKTILLDHDYDGIQEFDYPLPMWWTVTFIICCIFGIPYIVFYNFMDSPTQQEELNAKMAVINKTRAELREKSKFFTMEDYKAVVADGGVEKGALVYEENCLSCHEENGKGDIGPNLTDSYWIHAKGDPESLYTIVFNGYEENGMPPWGEELDKKDIYSVVAYVMTLKNTNVEGGKEPQGEKVED